MGSRNNKPGRIVKGTALQPNLKDASGIWSLDEAMQAHRANAWPQPNLFQPISNSLRLKQQGGSISAGVLSKPIVRDGNRNRFTMSMWVKLGTLAAPGGSIRTLWEGFSGADNSYYLIYISSGNQLYIGRDDNASPGGTTATWAGVLRDPNAWYHIVIATDTLQATAANRIKVWINGVQQTLGGDFPAQGYAVAMGVGDRNNNSVTNGFGPGIRIGSRWGLTFDQNFDGLYGEVNFVDGYQLDPSLFGKFDTNNTWVPVAYTGSYGTNGFYLPFTNATTSQTLGYDASLNGTTTYDADQDPYRGHVALHLTGNGPAGSQNNTFTDSSSTNNSITRTGEITQGSFSPYPLNANAPYNPAINGASAYFPKSGWLSAPTAAVSSLGTGDFTFESWVYPITFSTTTLFQRWFSFGTGLASDVTVNIDTSGYLVFRINDSIQLTSATTLTLNAWNHVAFVRSSGTVKFYINGYSGNSAAVATNITTQGQNPIIIGAEPGQSQGSAGDFYGYMSNFRVIKGVAVYTANFTPTNRPFGSLTNNLLTFSEDFANTAFWAQSNVSVTPSFAVAPDGTPSATKLILTSGNSLQKRLNFTSYTPGAGTYTFSVYAKAADYNYLVVTIYESSYKGAVFNLATGVIESTLASTTTSMTSVGNGWYRISVTATTGGTLNNNATGLWPYQNLPGNAGGNATSDGNSSGGVYIWGAQFESASSPSNYVPTPANFSTAPSLLLNFANAAVVDSAGTNNALTGGSATITSASKYGGGALSFASNGYLSFAPGSQYAFRTSDFTIEAWVRTTETTGDGFYRRIYMTDGPTGNAVGNIQLTIEPSTGYVNLWETSGGLDMLGTTNISTGAWFHVAATRAGTTLRLFVNGKQEAIRSHNTSIAPNSGTPRPWVGAYNSTQGRWNGQIDDLRVTKGLARYTSDFAPPARALPETGGDSFVTRNINAGVVRSFTTVGTTSWTAPLDVTQIELLVVAGGGGGGTSGANYCGGGGAGGLIYNSAYPVTPGAGYSITVGAGGAAQANGSNSVFGPLIAIGGGAGASAYATAGSSGGSGGGGGPINGFGGNGTAGQGFAGGIASSANQGGSDSGAGGGGGAGGIGGPGFQTGTGQFSNSPNGGGQGLNFGISGIPKWYAAGGTGSGYYYGGDTGTNGIGGSTPGAGGSSAVINGTANTGAGGGGGRSGTGGAGGSGIVIVRYTTTSTDATSDNLVDSPTQYGHDTGAGGEVVGNYVTWNPLDKSPTAVLSGGNLDITPGFSTQTITRATMSIPLGQWYFEVTCRSTAGDASAGEIGFNTTAARAIDGGYTTWAVNSIYYTSTSGNKNIFGTSTAYGATWTANDIIGVAIDTVAGTIVFYKNGVSQGTITNGLITPNTLFPVFANNSTSGSRNVSANFGQRAWAYAPPAGFNAITTKNLPRLAIGSAAATPNEYFDTVLYTGNGSTQTISSLNFQPDLVWNKTRSNGYVHGLWDSVRGAGKHLMSNLTNGEITNDPDGYLSAFNSNGFTLIAGSNSSATWNLSSGSYVAWCWRAGGAAVSNTAGTITSSVSANTTSGFSIVTYTGNGTAGATVGHGLGAAPNLVIWKKRSSTSNWFVWSKAMDVLTGVTGWLYLNATNTQQTSGSTNEYPTYKIDPTSTLITLNGTGSSNGVNDSSATYVAYCWTEIPGFSKFGTFTANANTDGPFIYCGFKPRFVLGKDITSASTNNWFIFDTARDTYNGGNSNLLRPNLSDAELANANRMDILSNGFKVRGTALPNNTAGDNYIFMAFAEKPFGNVNGTAR